MKVLIYGINYAPELTGIGKYTGEMASWMSKKGFEVRAITGFPYYPNWKIQKPYKGWIWKKEMIDNVEVTRCPLYIPQNVNSLKRILHEFSFLLSSTIVLLLNLFRPTDALVCVVTPFHLGLPARLFAWLKGIPMVYHIQDLQVDAARDMKMIKNQSLLNVMETAEKWIMRKSTLVSTISDGMKQKIVDKGISDSHIVLNPNWVDAKVIYPMQKSESLRKELGFKAEDQIVLYSGNLGEKQGLENIIEVAKDSRHIPNRFFVIVGEGGGKGKLIQLAEDANLSNVKFFPLQPYEKLSALLAMADLHLVLQKKAAADLVMPSKLTSILAAGGCALVTAEQGTSLYDTVANYGLGITALPEDLDDLKDKINWAFNNDLNFYKSNARKYATQYLDKENILERFSDTLFSLSTGKLILEKEKR